MTWLKYHRESEEVSALAETAYVSGDFEKAKTLFGKAAEAETLAMEALDISKVRTIGISAVSAVSLLYKSGNLLGAEKLAHQQLAKGILPEFAVDQLRGLLNSAWNEQIREKANVGFAPGQVVVSVKGGEIIEGGAPLDLIVEKVQIVQSIFYRTAEMLKNLPHRKHGAPGKDIQDTCRPWIFQMTPGSYQFAIAIQDPKQQDLFEPNATPAKDVAGKFLTILRATVEDPSEELAKIVPDAEYRKTFLKLTRNLAPTGKKVGQIDLKAGGELRSLSLVPEIRTAVNKFIREQEKPSSAEEQQVVVKGILRAVHLDQDWLEILVDGTAERITGLSDAVDDVIGPMVNHNVVARVIKGPKNKMKFLDIENEE